MTKFLYDKKTQQIVEVEEHTDHLDARGSSPGIRRFKEYQDIGAQLNYLYDDIVSGRFGEDAKTGKFAGHLNAIKLKYPKQINTDGEQ